MNPHLWWYVSRASGITAWALCSAAVVWGLALSTRVAGRRTAAPWLLDLHRFLGGLSVVFVAVHVSALTADGYTHFGLADLLVPFASSWKPSAVAWGIVAMYVLVAVELTSLLKRRLPQSLWRRVHLGSFVLWVTATAHLLFAGTDAADGPLLVATIATTGLVAFLTAYRFLAPRRRVPRSPAPAVDRVLRPQPVEAHHR